jgi:hypothetical protein
MYEKNTNREMAGVDGSTDLGWRRLSRPKKKRTFAGFFNHY